MKKLLFFLVVIQISSCATVKEFSPTKQFEWLIGNWIMKDESGVTIENWQKNGQNGLLGSSSMGKTERTLKPFENVTLNHTGKFLVYVVTTANQNDAKPITFTILNYTAKSFIAQNIQHDYPKRIGYELINKDSIVAFIDDGEPNSQKKYYFNYSRIK